MKLVYPVTAFFPIISLLLTSCQQSSVDSITPTNQAVSLTPTFTNTPTSTSTPSATPFPPLSGEPPYLLIRPYYDSQELFIYDHNGSGKNVVKLPKGGLLRGFGGLEKSISPDGNWIIYYEGTLEGGGDPDNLPVSVNILNLKNGATKKIADVVTEGYQTKLENLSKKLKEFEPDYYMPMDGVDWAYQSVAMDFRWTINSFAWSPDSKKIAFAGHINGESSDSYLYDFETETVTRVEDTLHNVEWITWSPDGTYLVFTDSHPGYVYTGSILYSIAATEFTKQKPRLLTSGTWLYVGDWLSPSKLLTAQGTDTAGLFGMQSTDIITGRSVLLWDDGFGDFVLDYENRSIIFTASEYADSEKFGIYEVSFGGKLKKILDGLYWVDIFLRNGAKHRYLIAGGDDNGEIKLSGEVVGVNEENEPTYFGDFDHSHIIVSPDNKWLLMYDDEKMYLYDQYDELIDTFFIPDVYSVLWTPDSSEIFYSTSDELFLLDINNGSTQFIDRCLEERCSLRLGDNDSMWLP